MKIDLTPIYNNNEIIIVNLDDINFTEYLENSLINNITKVKFNGNIKKNIDDSIILEGNLDGQMYLLDDITLEEKVYPFSIQIEDILIENDLNLENNLKNMQNTIDIIPLLWQNIVLEVPTKFVSEENQNLHLEGDGWRLMTEEEFENKSNNKLNDLKELFEARKE